MSAWGPMLRRARRLAWRAPVRTVATGLLVVLPVAAMTLLLGSVWSAYRWDSAHASGGADARYPITAIPPEVVDQVERVVRSLPEGSSDAVIESYSGVVLASVGPEEPVRVVQGPWRSKLVHERVALAAGHLPGPGEVVVSPWLSARHGIDVGDTLRLTEPEGELRVSGIGQSQRWDEQTLMTGPGELMPTGVDPMAPGPMIDSAEILVDLPPGATAPVVPSAEMPNLAGPGDTVVSDLLTPEPRASVSAPTAQMCFFTAVAAVFVVVGAGAAFGIGAARRRRAMGLLAVNGADAPLLRRAAAAEALVVALPAAVLGAAVAAAVPSVWVGLRLPGWDAVWDIRFPWPWIGLLVVVAWVAAAVGAVLFSRSLRSASPSSLLDRPRGRRTSPERRRRAPQIVAVSMVILLLGLATIWSRQLGLTGAYSRLLVTVAVVGAWVVLGTVVLLVARRLLGRGVIGRLVVRDLTRRPLGALTAATLTAVWVFGALAAAADASYDELGGSSSTWFYYGDAGSPTPTARSTAGGSQGVVFMAPQPLRVALRGQPAPPPASMPETLQTELAAAGLPTVGAQRGSFTGPCTICPPGWVPTVAVLDGLEGSGLPGPTQDLLRAGHAVTGFQFAAGAPAEVGGVQVAQGEQPLPVDAVVLREAVPSGLTLTEPQAVLVGSFAGLSDAQLAEVAGVVESSGVEVRTWDDQFATARSELRGERAAPAAERTPWLTLTASFLVLLAVSLAAAVAHRREHREAVRVLGVLGASPGSARRLSSLTSGAVSTAGVLLGSGAAVVAVVVALGGSSSVHLIDVVWSRAVLSVLAVAVAVPLAVTALGWATPPPRPERAAAQLGPA